MWIVQLMDPHRTAAADRADGCHVRANLQPSPPAGDFLEGDLDGGDSKHILPIDPSRIEAYDDLDTARDQ